MLGDHNDPLCLQAHLQVFTPASFRKASRELNAQLGDKWVIRDYDLQVEFYFRDMSILPGLAADPDFQAMQVSVQAVCLVARRL